MKAKSIRLLLALMLFSLGANNLTLACFSKHNQVLNSSGKEWQEDMSFGFPVQIALDSPVNVRTRKIYLYVKAQDFTQENIKKVLTGFAEKYKQIEILFITAYSQKEHLIKLIEAESSCCLFFAPTPEGKKALKQHLEILYPPPTGYYRARYERDLKEEFLLYSPDPEKKEMIKLKLD